MMSFIFRKNIYNIISWSIVITIIQKGRLEFVLVFIRITFDPFRYLLWLLFYLKRIFRLRPLLSFLLACSLLDIRSKLLPLILNIGKLALGLARLGRLLGSLIRLLLGLPIRLLLILGLNLAASLEIGQRIEVLAADGEHGDEHAQEDEGIDDEDGVPVACGVQVRGHLRLELRVQTFDRVVICRQVVGEGQHGVRGDHCGGREGNEEHSGA